MEAFPPKKGAKLTFARLPVDAFWILGSHILTPNPLKVQMRNTRLDVYISGRWIKTMGPHLSTAMQ